MLGTEAAIITDLWIPGRPKPKGSLKNIARAGRPVRLVEQVEGSTEWKRTVRNAVVRHVRTGSPSVWERWAGTLPLTAAVLVTTDFYFTPPAGPANVGYPCGLEGDLDKLIRNVGDALTESGLIKDDRQIVRWAADKLFVGVHGVTLPNEEGLHLSVRLAP